jgi:hypothetical protein
MLAAAGASALIAAAYRFVTFRGFSNDQYMHLAWAQQVTKGAWPGLDFMEPGMPLTIALSAIAQAAGGRGLPSELVLCLLMVAATAALTCWLAVRFSGSVTLGLMAALLQIAIFPRLYNYPKFFVPIVGVALLWRYIDRPSARAAALVGVWITTGFLFRHDYLLYVGLGALAAFLMLAGRIGAREALRHAAICAGTSIVLVLPYLFALTMLGGIESHVRDAAEYFQGEDNQWTFPVPGFALSSADGGTPLSQILSRDNITALLYYGVAVLPLGLMAGASLGALRRRPRRFTVREAQAIVLALVTLSLAVIVVRHPIDERLIDAGGPMPLVLVVVASALAARGAAWRRVAYVGIAAAAAAVVLHGEVHARLEDADALKGPRPLANKVRNLWVELQRPPWEDYWPAGDLPQSIGYLRACTSERDRVLVTWFAPEVFIFADRGFGAGHAIFIRRSFFAPEFQRRMIGWLDRERTPVALINADQEWFRTRLPLLQYYLDERYTVVGTDRFRDTSVDIAIRRDSHPTGVHAETGWPCLR